MEAFGIVRRDRGGYRPIVRDVQREMVKFVLNPCDLGATARRTTCNSPEAGDDRWIAGTRYRSYRPEAPAVAASEVLSASPEAVVTGLRATTLRAPAVTRTTTAY